MRLLGHRGAQGEAPESTIPGFVYASRLPGLAGVEFDVQLSRDDRLVVIHDETVDRTTNAHGRVADFTAAELAALDARAAFPDWPEPCGVPALDQVLAVVKHMSVLQIEIKHDTPDRLERVVPMLLRAIRDHGVEQQIVIISFDPVALEILGRVAPDTPRSLIGAYDTPAWLDRALALGCTQANVAIHKTPPALIAAAHESGLTIDASIADTPADLARSRALGADFTTTNYPARLLPLLAHQPS